MPTAKILLLSVSAGNGHTRAAEALDAAAKRWFPRVETLHLDLLSLTPTLFRKAYKDAYLRLVNSQPALWGYLYARTDRDKAENAVSKLRHSIEGHCNSKLFDVLESFKPDHIISTHFMPPQVLARRRAHGPKVPPVWVCVTDFVAHRYWLEPGLAGYFTATEENAWRMRSRGLHTERIIPCGIPIMPEFGDRCTRQEGAKAFGLSPDKTTFLLMGGGAGVGDMETLAAKILELPGDFQLAALAGKNTRLLTALRGLAERFPTRLFPLGFTNQVHTLMAACDLVISKPGGLTTVECLALGKPMLVVAPIPGQEEHNADHLLENGAALKACDTPGLLYRLDKLLREPQTLARLGQNAAALGKPGAAKEILETVLAG